MSKNAPTNAPKTVPTGWKNHWINYNEPRPVSHRGKIHWAVTKPKSLWKSTNRDKKLSSGTSDVRVAEERKWVVAAKIYQWFDDKLTELNTPQSKFKVFMQQAEIMWAERESKNLKGYRSKLLDNFPPIEKFGWPETDDVILLLHSVGVEVPDKMVDLVNKEAEFWLVNRPMIHEPSPFDKAADLHYGGMPNVSKKFTTDLDKKLAQKLSGTNRSVLSLSALIKMYVAETKWKRIKTRSSALSALKRFMSCVGDVDVCIITQKHGYTFAKYLEDELDLANKSIKSNISYVSGLFTWCIKQSELQGFVSNPFNKLNLSKYGHEAQSFIPFKVSQLHQLFGLADVDGKGRMNRREYLLFGFLITTGCRMDEAALLTWENIIRHDNGWHYIDLTKAIVKNAGSKRLLPIPYKLQSILPPSGHQLTVDGLISSPDGRLFNYSCDKDGKASRAASQALGRQIAKIKPDRGQVSHSLRGNLKDMLRDKGVSKELNDYITGHAQGDVASSYGSGHSIELRYEALNKPVHPYLISYGS